MILQVCFALYPLCLSGAAFAWVLRVQAGKTSGRLVEIAAGGSVAAFAFLTGPWAFTSYYLRYVCLGLFALAAVYSWRRSTQAGKEGKERTAGRLALSASVLLLFLALNGAVVAAHFRPQGPLDLLFPLAGGSYYVLQGGDSAVTNPFHALSGSKLALDIVKLNSFGNRAEGIASRRLDDYEIFDDWVYGPCAGTVLAVRGHLQDNAPGEVDAEHPEGNFIVIKCAGREILLAHLKQGSIMVAAGQEVRPGRPLGRVGNSGNTLEPHLHIEARVNGLATGLQFEGRRLSMNDVVKKTIRPQGGEAPCL